MRVILVVLLLVVESILALGVPPLVGIHWDERKREEGEQYCSTQLDRKEEKVNSGLEEKEHFGIGSSFSCGYSLGCE